MGDLGGPPGGAVRGPLPELARRGGRARAGRRRRLTPDVNPVAREGFGRGARAYHEARPGWPRAALTAAFDHFGLEPESARVVDLAAGTGRLTQELVALGVGVRAVEPLDEMRALIAGAPALAGTAEAIPLADASVDAVFVAEAFHWFHAPAALREIARVLRPGGGLALMWNVGQPDDAEWRQEVAQLVAPVYKHPQGRRVPSASGNDWREQTEWQRGPGWELFEAIEQRSFEHVQRLTRDQYVTLVSSWSFVGALGDDDRSSLLAAIGAVLERHAVDEFEQAWRTDVYLTRAL